MQIDPTIFKSYDIRGLYPSQINEETIVAITSSIYNFFCGEIGKKQLQVVLGRDMRLSSPSLFEKAKQTLTSMGAHVIDVGLVSTPTFYFAVWHYEFDCGIQITASHNPKDYNGIKFVKRSEKGLVKIGKSTGMEEVKRLSLQNTQHSSSQKGSTTMLQNVVQEEVKNALSLFGTEALKYFTIVADPANAMGATYLEALFKIIPANLIRMNFTLDGTFPVHQPDPLDYNNLKDLQERVLREKADFGLAPDGDGDRLFFIDEKGSVVPASIITALIARELLKKSPGAKILFDIRYILTPKQIIEENGGTYEISKVGHAFITEQMGKTGALFAGESSAHYFYKATGNAESQLATVACVLKVLSESGKSLSQLAQELRRSYESGEINFKLANAQEVIDTLKTTFSDSELSELDGIAISYPTWRFNVRISNTEPLLRLNVEAIEESVMQTQSKRIVGIIDKAAHA